MPQLNHGNPHVREFLFDVAEHWVRRGIDGWRFDAPETIAAPGFWQAMRARLRALDPEVYLVGELWTDASTWLDGTQWDGAMNYPLGGLIRWFAAHERLCPEHLHAAARPEGLLDGARFAHQVELLVARHPWEIALAQLNLVDSHDLARFLTVAGGDQRSVELATVLLFTLPGVPCILYGDEVGLTGGMPPDCRRGFPDPERWDVRLLALHRELIGLRRSSAVLAEGRHRTIAAAGFAVAYERRLEAERMLVAVNAGDEPAALPVALAPFERALLRVGDADVSGGRLSLGPRSAVVVGSS
jgi:neopullulanase